MMQLERLGEFLREGRGSARWTLRETEEQTGVSNSYLSQLESAKIKQPSPVVLHKLCSKYRISYATAMELAGYPLPEKAQFATEEARFFSRLGRTSSAEQEALLDHLSLLRSKRRY